MRVIEGDIGMVLGELFGGVCDNDMGSVMLILCIWISVMV